MRSTRSWLLLTVTTTLGLGCGRGDKAASAPCPTLECPQPEAAHGSATAAVAVVAPPANPVQAEMRLLATAMEVAVRGVGTGDVTEVAHALHRVHEAKAATEAALKGGAYRPARNGDQVAAFVAMDEAFHAHLERLVMASRAGDVAATATALGDALEGCQGCHLQFRAAPAPAAPAAPTAPPDPHHH